MINFVGAKDETYGVFFQALKAASPAILGYEPDVRWHNVEKPPKPPIDKFYFRAKFETIKAAQAGFTDCSEASASRLYEERGMASFSLYAPRTDATSDRKSDLLLIEIRKAFRAPRLQSSVWFRNQRIHPTYPEDQFLRTILTVEFYFTEVG